jgi:hypothetical protein
MAYKQMTTSYLPTWKPTKQGDEIEGYYIDKKTNQGKNKNSNQYTLLTKDGDIAVWGSVVLDRNFGSIPIGCKVKIVYQGKVVSKNGNDVNTYDFFYDDKDKVSPSVSRETPTEPDIPPDLDFEEEVPNENLDELESD